MSSYYIGVRVITAIRLVLVCCLLSVGLSSCSGKTAKDEEAAVPLQPLSCIAVLPAVTSVAKDDTVHYDEARMLEKGATYATVVMISELSDNSNVKLVNQAQMATVSNEVSGGISGTITAIGKAVNCDGVLTTTVRRFLQREGTELAVDRPASADFMMVLRHAPTGAILWSADFQETQEPLLSNIFSFNKAQKRGFHWVTAEQLLEQGIQERLGECPYFE